MCLLVTFFLEHNALTNLISFLSGVRLWSAILSYYKIVNERETLNHFPVATLEL